MDIILLTGKYYPCDFRNGYIKCKDILNMQITLEPNTDWP